MSNHTPGPWRFYLERNYAYIEAVKYGATLAKVDGEAFVDIYQPSNEKPNGEWYEMSREERDANAELIASAPEMADRIRQLEAALRAVEWGAEDDGCQSCWRSRAAGHSRGCPVGLALSPSGGILPGDETR
jgi:hypothetical protein